MFDYNYTDVESISNELLYSNYEIEVNLDTFKETKYPLELYEYVFNHKAYYKEAIEYIQQILFNSESKFIQYDSILFCLEYACLYEDIEVITKLPLNNLENSFIEEQLRIKMWDLLSCEEYSKTILEVIKYFNWTDSFYNSLISEGTLESKICAELLLEGISTNPYGDAECMLEDSEEDVQFDTYLLPRLGYTQWAYEEYKKGLYGTALMFIEYAKDSKTYKSFPEYDDKRLDELKDKIMNNHSNIYNEIEKRFNHLSEFLTPNARQALIHAEYLFQVHGEALNEYSSILNAYARCIEIQLKEVFLPKLKELIDAYGNLDKQGKKFLIYLHNNKKQKLFYNIPDYKYTLGKFHHLFYVKNKESLEKLIWDKRKYENILQYSKSKIEIDEKIEKLIWKDDKEKYLKYNAKEKENYKSSLKEETFYGALYDKYKTQFFPLRFLEFGKLLKKITNDYRNEASHGSVTDFEKVIQIRNDMGIYDEKENIFELLSFAREQSLVK